jgi:hypothetical protein
VKWLREFSYNYHSITINTTKNSSAVILKGLNKNSEKYKRYLAQNETLRLS